MKFFEAIPGKPIPLGRLGENERLTVVFDVSAWLEELPGAAIGLINRLPKADEGYPVILGYPTDGKVSWIITSAELSVEGDGDCELIATIGTVVAKSEYYRTVILESLDGSGEVPDQWETYQAQFTAIAGEATAAQAGAEAAQKAAEDAQDAAEDAAELAEMWATGETGGTPAVNNNAEYWSGKSESFKNEAKGYSESAEASAGTAATAASNAAASAQSAAAQVQLVEAAGAAQVALVEAEGTTQVAAVEDKGAEVLESIPEDYSTLSSDVSDLKSKITSMNTATASDVGKALSPKTVADGKVTEWKFVSTGGGGGGTDHGIPEGGTAGQVLGKNSATDYDVEWVDGSSGVYVGTSEPTDPTINVWINPDGASWESEMLGEIVDEVLEALPTWSGGSF